MVPELQKTYNIKSDIKKLDKFFEQFKESSKKCDMKLENGVYYMICDGEKVPVEADIPPAFLGNCENLIKEAFLISKGIL